MDNLEPALANNKTQTTTPETTPRAAFDLTSQILGKIETEAVTPRGRWVYLTEEYSLWALWAATVVLGALSVAVTLFVLAHQRFALYELTHRDFTTFAVDVLPTLWLALFTAMVIFAVFNLRQTKRGYRYPLWQILGSSLALSLVLGSFLHVAGAGFSLDKKMGVWSKGYPSQEKLELKWWQNPGEGRLVGKAMYIREGADTEIRFIDMAGTAWQLTLDELHEGEKQLISEGKQVRIFGAINSDRSFHACGAMPWVQDRSYRGEELDEIRQVAREKIETFREEKMAMMASSTICGELMRLLPRPPKLAW
jgi:hypothetical protein